MVKHIPIPPQDELLELFAYDPESGDLFNKISTSPGARSGDLAGSVDLNGYRKLKIKGKYFYSHRIIWKMMTNEDPGKQAIDHLDRNPSNNSWCNLRLITPARQERKRNSYGKGCSLHKKTNKWMVRISANGHCFYGGLHATEESARQAADELRAQVHGDFAAAPTLAAA